MSINVKLHVILYKCVFLGESSDIFATILYNHYSPIEGFHFDKLKENNAIVDEKGNPENNIHKKVIYFLITVIIININIMIFLCNKKYIYIFLSLLLKNTLKH